MGGGAGRGGAWEGAGSYRGRLGLYYKPNNTWGEGRRVGGGGAGRASWAAEGERGVQAGQAADRSCTTNPTTPGLRGKGRGGRGRVGAIEVVLQPQQVG